MLLNKLLSIHKGKLKAASYVAQGHVGIKKEWHMHLHGTFNLSQCVYIFKNDLNECKYYNT